MSKKTEITVADQSVRVVEYRGQRVVTFAMIDAVHKRPDGTAKRTFHDNRERFIEGEDYVALTADAIRTESLSGVFPPRTPQGFIITESGYLMLTKTFSDDLAWQVQRQLVNRYFRKEEPAPKVTAGNTALDKLRTANALKLAEETAARICSRFANLGDSAQQLIYAKIINPIVGDEVLMLPAVQEQHFTAAEVGERFGITAAMVGRIANQHSLKSAEYGEFFLDKSPHSAKQVETFRYNERGAARIGELAGAAVATAAVMSKALPADSAGPQLFE